MRASPRRSPGRVRRRRRQAGSPSCILYELPGTGPPVLYKYVLYKLVLHLGCPVNMAFSTPPRSFNVLLRAVVGIMGIFKCHQTL